jgi:hypothetical protein
MSKFVGCAKSRWEGPAACATAPRDFAHAIGGGTARLHTQPAAWRDLLSPLVGVRPGKKKAPARTAGAFCHGQGVGEGGTRPADYIANARVLAAFHVCRPGQRPLSPPEPYSPDDEKKKRALGERVFGGRWGGYWVT